MKMTRCSTLPTFRFYPHLGWLHDVHALDIALAGPEPSTSRSATSTVLQPSRGLLRHACQVEHDAHRIRRRRIADNLPGRLLHPSGLPRTSAAHRFKDPESGKTLVFITNNFSLPLQKPLAGGTLLQVDRSYLRIKQFYGTSENAVKTQIWIAVSTSSSPSSRSASTWTPRSTLCYRSSR